MDILTSVKRFRIKLLNWEYWNMYVIYFPINLIWFYYALRARKLFFFTGVNPGMHTSGFFGASKFKILSKIPAQYKPDTSLIARKAITKSQATRLIKERHSLPFIVKPDIGERGLMVRKIETMDQFDLFYDKYNFDFIVQEFSTYTEEYSILCFNDPSTREVVISSLCKKEFLTVTGDGISDLRSLILEKPRAILQFERLKKENNFDLNCIPALKETILLEPIGNHSRGTKFLDYNHHISPALTKVFGNILNDMNEISYGRFDIKAKSLSDLENGKHIHILEFNGTASEPSHCYDPKHSLLNFYRSMNYHWSKMFQIYKANKKNQSTAMTPMEYIYAYKSYRKLTTSYYP